MNTVNLMRLAARLRTVPPGQWNFEHWCTGPFSAPEGAPVQLECGTTACALGWAATMPEFAAMGLTVKRPPYGFPVVCLVSYTPDETYWFTGAVCTATKHVFGLTEAETGWLFVPSDDFGDDDAEYGDDGRPAPRATADTVADHIENFVRHGGIPE